MIESKCSKIVRVILGFLLLTHLAFHLQAHFLITPKLPPHSSQDAFNCKQQIPNLKQLAQKENAKA
jgi:hypothetical protein